MKTLSIILLVLVSFNMQAQDKKEERMVMKKERLNKLTAEDMAEIQTKKMVLALDLSDLQQQQVKKINLENITLRREEINKKMTLVEKGEKPSDEAQLKMQNEKLDQRIAVKREMKKILDDEQYKKWNNRDSRKHEMHRHKKKDKNKEKDHGDYKRKVH